MKARKYKESFIPPPPAKDAKIIVGPKAEQKDGKVVIRFAVDKATDVTVRIIDEQGKVVRNLASGVLGKNAPEPFRKENLSQEIEWDKKDDDGKAVKAGKYVVRMDVGAGAKFERFLASSPDALAGTIADMDTDTEGRLYVKTVGKDYWIFKGNYLVSDREGKFLRSVLPYNPNVLSPQGVGRSPYEYKGGVSGHVSPPWLSTGGGENVFLPAEYGTKMIDRYGFVAAAGLNFGSRRWPYAVDGVNVYQVKDQWTSIVKYSLPARSPLKDFEYAGKDKLPEKTQMLGVPKQPGHDEKHFRKIAHLEVGSDGKIYVADENAVKVFQKNGLYLGSIPVGGCRRLAVGRKTSSIYLLLPGEIAKFTAWPEAKKAWSLKVPRGVNALTIDESAEPACLWVGNLKGAGGFSRVAVGGDRPGKPVHFGGYDRPVFIYPGHLDVDDKGNLYVLDNDRNGVIRVNASDGSGWKALSGVGSLIRTKHRNIHSMVVDRRERYLYLIICRFLKFNPRAISVNGLYRFTLDGRPAPFAKSGSNHIKMKEARSVAVGRDGTIYVNVKTRRRFKDWPGIRFFYKGKFHEVARDGAFQEKAYEGPPVTKWDKMGSRMIRECGKCHVVSFPDGSRRMVHWSAKPEDVFANIAHIDAYSKDGELVKEAVATPFICSGDMVIDSRGSLTVTDINFAVTHKEGFMGPFTSTGKYSFLVKFAPGGGVRWVRGVEWEKLLGRAIRSDGTCHCSKSYLEIDELDRLYHPDRGSHCVEILDRAGNLIAVVGSYGNRECAGPGSQYPKPEIPLDAVIDVAAADDALWISDSRNRRVIKCKLVYHQSKNCEIDLTDAR